MGEEDLEIEKTSPAHGEDQRGDEAKAVVRKGKKKKKSLKEGVKAEKRGICHLRRVPPRMDHVILRQVLSQYGEIQRIYLVPEAPAAQMSGQKAGGFRGQAFSEGWIEFTKKSVAKRLANMLNGQQIVVSSHRRWPRVKRGHSHSSLSNSHEVKRWKLQFNFQSVPRKSRMQMLLKKKNTGRTRSYRVDT